MKTLDYVLKNYKSDTLDGRDLNRLADFVPEDRLKEIGIDLKPGYEGKHKAKPWTKTKILKQLKEDVEFGFEKALNKRGISAGLMFYVVKMWNWILEEGLEDFSEDDYAQYGLPLFKATAEKYNFDNPIGADTGSEHKYSDEYDEDEDNS